MLDTKGRKFVDPIINSTANILLKLNLSANNITILAFLIGLSSSYFVYIDKPLIAILILWLSGFLDAVDGSMARKSNSSSSWGALMDITFDRLVEISIIISLALKNADIIIYLLILSTSIIFSMTVFLTVGALSNQKGIKSFYYQAGLAERTEGFILFSLMILFQNYLVYITSIFIIMIIITALQRMIEAYKILKDVD